MHNDDLKNIQRFDMLEKSIIDLDTVESNQYYSLQ